MVKKILDINDLTVTFETDEGVFNAVDQVSLNIGRGEIVGLVGESGCGKTITALSITRLIPSPPGRIANGKILFNGKDLLQLGIKEMRRIRGREISMIFQEPSAALSPLHRIGHQMVETIRMHRKISKKEAWKLSEQWLGKVGISDAKERMFALPHQLSGGMQQRVMISMALMTEPNLLIADEPTTALDVTIQMQIFELIRAMKSKDVSILIITHDMGVIWEMCDRVVVMYASEIVEEGLLNDIFSSPAHPYTKGLLNSIPKLGCSGKRLKAVAGYVPSPYNYPKGCHFADRCEFAFKRCREEKPTLKDIGNNRKAACFLL
ncbi:MAG: ABC transporter ATP-binding protein [Deltaproteobacteria bacterium]|nr:ABC transporter ATP-binding protein [Deltaproteobacteria bacterium]